MEGVENVSIESDDSIWDLPFMSGEGDNNVPLARSGIWQVTAIPQEAQEVFRPANRSNFPEPRRVADDWEHFQGESTRLGDSTRGREAAGPPIGTIYSGGERARPKLGKFNAPGEFPKDIPQSEKYERWIKYKQLFDIALSICDGSPMESQKAGLLFMYAGEEVRQIVTTLSLPPLHGDRLCCDGEYVELSRGINAFFRALVDDTTDVARYEAKKQEPGESVHQYLMKLRELAAAIKIEHGSPHFKFHFLEGLANKELAKRATEEKLEMKTIVDRAGRIEQEAEMARTKAVQEPVMVAAVVSSHQQGPFKRGKDRKSQSRKRKFDNRGIGDGTGCKRCNQAQHRSESDCPALKFPCLNCGKTGHFRAVCKAQLRSKVGKMDSSPKKEKDQVKQHED